MLINSKKNLGFNFKTSAYLVLLFLIFSSNEGIAQIDIQRYTTATDTFHWKRYTHVPKPPKVSLKRFSVSKPAKVIDSFLALHGSQFPQFTNDSVPVLLKKSLIKSLYAIDINGDQLPDIVFSGYSGGETEMVSIWLNHGDSFELVFEDYQYFSKFIRSGNKLVEIQTGDAGGDSNYLYFTRDYRVTHDNGESVFIKGKQTVTYKYTEEPANCYPVPIPFIAKADTMMVRASAAQQNEPFIPGLDTFGNIVAKYRTRASGTAIAYKSNGKGNDWFFVEISPNVAPSASILYGLDKMPTFIRGWVSGQAITLTSFK